MWSYGWNNFCFINIIQNKHNSVMIYKLILNSYIKKRKRQIRIVYQLQYTWRHWKKIPTGYKECLKFVAHTWDANDEVKATLLVFPPHQCYVQVQIVFTGLEIVPDVVEVDCENWQSVTNRSNQRRRKKEHIWNVQFFFLMS